MFENPDISRFLNEDRVHFPHKNAPGPLSVSQAFSL